MYAHPDVRYYLLILSVDRLQVWSELHKVELLLLAPQGENGRWYASKYAINAWYVDDGINDEK